jgi:hypothetical protein
VASIDNELRTNSIKSCTYFSWQQAISASLLHSYCYMWKKCALIFVSIVVIGVDVWSAEMSSLLQVRDDNYLNLPPMILPEIHSKRASLSLVDSSLTAEFNRKYEEKFGPLRNQEAFIISNPNQVTYSNEDKTHFVGVIESETVDRRKFGEYMLRRLFEFQTEGLLKRDPNMRTVVKIKEKISNVEVKVRDSWAVKAKYSFSDNILDLMVTNPYLDARVSAEPDEVHVVMGRKVQDLFYLKLDAGMQGSLAISGSKDFRGGVKGEVVACYNSPIFTTTRENALIGTISMRF